MGTCNSNCSSAIKEVSERDFQVVCHRRTKLLLFVWVLCCCFFFLFLLKRFLSWLSLIFFSFLLKGNNKFAKICSASFRQTLSAGKGLMQNLELRFEGSLVCCTFAKAVIIHQEIGEWSRVVFCKARFKRRTLHVPY